MHYTYCMLKKFSVCCVCSFNKQNVKITYTEGKSNYKIT